jgi:hypothetical protein
MAGVAGTGVSFGQLGVVSDRPNAFCCAAAMTRLLSGRLLPVVIAVRAPSRAASASVAYV